MAGILDGLLSLNPFGNAAQQSADAFAKGDTSYYPPAPAAPPQDAPMAPSSRQASNPMAAASAPSSTYSPMTDPEGPLARSGWIGALLFGNGQSHTDYAKSLQEQKQKQIGMARGQAYQKFTEIMQQPNMTPQKAFMNFMNTPQGMNFIVTDPDPNQAVQMFMKMGVDQSQQIWNAPGAASGAAAPAAPGMPGGAPNPAAVQQSQKPVDIFAPDPTAPNTGGVDIGVGGSGMPSGQPLKATPDQLTKSGDSQAASLTAEDLRTRAQKLASIKDYQGAELATRLAEQYDKAAQAGKPPTTDDLKEYAVYEQQERGHGRDPKDYTDWKVGMTLAANNKTTPTDMAYKARLEVDTDAAKKAQEAFAKAANSLPALEEAERVSKSVRGGYAGALQPILGKVLTSFGYPVTDEMSDAEMLNAIQMQLMPIVRQPGQVSNYEQKTYGEALPSLLQTQAGRAKIAGLLRKQIERASEVAQVYRDNLGKDDLNKKLQEVYSRPIMTPQELKDIQDEAHRADIMGPDAGAQATAKGGKAAAPAGEQTTQKNGARLPAAKQDNPPAQAQPAAKPDAAPAQKAGSVYRDEDDGIYYRFKGGDPNSKDSWEQVDIAPPKAQSKPAATAPVAGATSRAGGPIR